ncbi:MAG: aminotransferase class I/II-fold pyridoxal phosphate-dependent enzyme [Bacteroidales bacterium]|nr:aminotransferase class I/II-fold pyridoxal phosphate-dependent enzyme [Bacteroidales bacterium]
MKIKPADRLNFVSEYYFSQKLKEIEELRAQGKDVINLGIGSPDLPPSEETIETLVSESRKSNNHAYQSYTGIPALRNAFADWYAKHFQVKLNPDQEILPLMGSKEGIMHISMAFLNPGDEVLVPNPGYPAYAAVARLVQANVKLYDLNESDGQPDWEALDSMDLSNVKLMWVNYPHMPTGKKASRETFEKLIDFGRSNDILIVNDNPYSFILNEEHLSLLSIPGAKVIALELNSLSKSHNMAGWRIGMLAGHKEYIQSVLRVKSNMDSGMFKPLQLAAVKALAADEKWYHELNRVYSKRREIVLQLFDRLNCLYDSDQSGMFVWAKIPEEAASAQALSDQLLEQTNVFITPGFIFGLNGERFFRISLCTEENRLKEALSRIKQFESEKIKK